MGKPDNDEEENASFIVYRVPGCSLHSCDYEKKKTQGLNYYSHFREKKREVQRTTISSSKSHN